MGEVVTVAFNRQSVDAQSLQQQLELLTRRVLNEVYKGSILAFLSDFQHECMEIEPFEYKHWLHEKLGTIEVTAPFQ